MEFDYPYTVTTVTQLVGYFEEMLKKKNNTGFLNPKTQYPAYISNLRSFKEKNDISLQELKTLIWGVLNDKSKVTSPMYATYFLYKLPEYKKWKEEYEEQLLEELEKDEEEKIEDDFNAEEYLKRKKEEKQTEEEWLNDL